MLVLSFQKYVSELSTVRDCVETCVEKGNAIFTTKKQTHSKGK